MSILELLTSMRVAVKPPQKKASTSERLTAEVSLEDRTRHTQEAEIQGAQLFCCFFVVFFLGGGGGGGGGRERGESQTLWGEEMGILGHANRLGRPNRKN